MRNFELEANLWILLFVNWDLHRSMKNKENKKLKFVSNFLIVIRVQCAIDRRLRIYFSLFVYFVYFVYLSSWYERRKCYATLLSWWPTLFMYFTCITRSLPCLAYYYTILWIFINLCTKFECTKTCGIRMICKKIENMVRVIVCHFRDEAN